MTRPPFRERTYVLAGAGAGRTALGRLLASGAALPARLPAQFQWQGPALVHSPTGARLPREHAGCRLAALAPLPAGYATGGIAEYDCRPASDLTYLTVVFAGNVPDLAGQDPLATARVAAGIATQETGLPFVACHRMDLGGVAGHVNRDLAAAQCGARWGDRTDASATYGTATVVVARGTTFVAGINTCVEPACDANRIRFGQFMDTFDQSGLKAALEPPRG